MVGLRDTLDRFRPAATPGAPGPRGVPADRTAERESELAPLFALLAETERETAEIRQRALIEADRLRLDATCRAEALIEEARVRADAIRAETAAHAEVSAARERERALRAAEDVTEQLSRRADERLPGLVARAIAIARNELAGESRTRP